MDGMFEFPWHIVTVIGSIVLVWLLAKLIDWALSKAEVFAKSAAKTRGVRGGILILCSVCIAPQGAEAGYIFNALAICLLVGGLISAGQAIKSIKPKKES